MSDSQLTLAAIQMVSGSDHNLNRDVSSRLIEEAAAAGANLIVLPENFLCFSARGYQALAQQIEPYLNHFCELSRKLKVGLVLGSLPMNFRPDGQAITDKLRSACICINAKGEIVGRYDKRHLFDVDVSDAQGNYRESNDFEAGEQVEVVSLGGVNVGLSICYDLRFPRHYQRLRDQGAEVIVVPAAFTAVTGKAHWEVLLRARAIENQCYLIAANQGGQHTSSRETWGHSMIIDPWGNVLTHLEKGEGFCLAAYDRQLLKTVRSDIPVVEHRQKADTKLS